MTGSAGDDTFVFHKGFGRDRITSGFDSNPSGGQNHLDLSLLGIGVVNFTSSVTIDGGAGNSTVITLVNPIDGNVITLEKTISRQHTPTKRNTLLKGVVATFMTLFLVVLSICLCWRLVKILNALMNRQNVYFFTGR
ncbi:hypothetical protein G163CM_18200 [Pseudocitrobacter corydidari]|uniref:Uncharacterized protein n=1 Tax=Pseudocitrobacter corydidari TaxID=2891570 RepID=A0ABY3S4V8_9ENTR|nr:hypothetical protein G163CM_18200 [Pseudocitrobacter corydidari]